jgi:hypothetical protein
MERRSFMSGLMMLLPASMLLKFKDWSKSWPYKPNTNLVTGECIPPTSAYLSGPTYSWEGPNDQFYDLFVDMKTGELIDGNEIRPFLDWISQHPEQPRWARLHYVPLPLTSNQYPRGHRMVITRKVITTYLDSELRPIEGTQSKAVGSNFAPRNPTVDESIRGKMAQINRI